MNKFVGFIVLVLLMSLCPACTRDNTDMAEKTTYEITELNYSEYDNTVNKDVSIVYPQVNGLPDKSIEEIICVNLKETAMDMLKSYSELNDMKIEVTYSVTFASDKILSVHFVSSAFHSTQAYPLIRSSSANFLLETGDKLEINDILLIDEEFIKSFHEIFYLSRDYSGEEEKDLILNDIRSTFDIEDIANTRSDNFYTEICSFLTKDSVVISIEIRYASGSYALFEANYSDLAKFLKIDIQN